MGYMDITINGSDEAADLAHVFKAAKTKSTSIKLLTKALKENNGRYNTSGAVNVALLIEDELITDKVYLPVVKTAYKKLSDEIKYGEKAEWDSDENKKYHLDSWNELLLVLKKFIKKSE